MSFADIEKQVATFVTGHVRGEQVHYQRVDDAGSWAWVARSAVVTELTEEEVVGIGRAYAKGPRPIQVLIRKEDVASINEKRDRIRWKEREYTVQAVLSETGGWWRLYCVR